MGTTSVLIRDLAEMTPELADKVIAAIRAHHEVPEPLFIRDIKSLTREEASRAVEKIMAFKLQNQKKREVQPDGAAALGHSTVPNPGHPERLVEGPLQVTCAQPGGEALGGRSGVDEPQRRDLFPSVPVRVSVDVVEVGAVGTSGMGDDTAFEVRIRLRVEGAGVIGGEVEKAVQANLRAGH